MTLGAVGYACDPHARATSRGSSRPGSYIERTGGPTARISNARSRVSDWRRDRDPARSSRAMKECLATLDDTAWGAASDVVPKFVSPSDPAAQWTGAHKGPAFFAYSDIYLIDIKFGVIVDVGPPGLGRGRCSKDHDRTDRRAFGSQVMRDRPHDRRVVRVGLVLTPLLVPVR